MIKDELFDSFIIECLFFIFYELFEQPKYLMILRNCKILIFQMVKYKKKFRIVEVWKFDNFSRWTFSNIWSFCDIVNYSKLGN